MDFEQKKTHASQLFDDSRAQEVHETSPTEISAALRAFAALLSSEPAEFIPVIEDPDGLFGYCNDGVLKKVSLDGGRPVFGWCIWEWPGVMWNAEFHCVWEAPDGQLEDITPKPQGETRIVFVPCRDKYPSTFDFDKRPQNERARIRPQIDKKSIAATRIAGMKESQLDYEMRRAKKEGKSLQEWLESKIPDDRLVPAIDEVIAATKAQETYLDSAGAASGQLVMDRDIAGPIVKRTIVALDEMKKLLKT